MKKMKKMLAMGLIAALLVGLMVVGAPDKALAATSCGTLTNATVQGDDSIKAIGDNFVVADCIVTPTSIASDPVPYGIYNNGFSGSIHHNTVTGGYHGILVDSGSTTPNPAVYVKIAYNIVKGFDKTGILNGRFPPNNAGVTADIRRNTVVDTASSTVARNGIAVEVGGRHGHEQYCELCVV